MSIAHVTKSISGDLIRDVQMALEVSLSRALTSKVRRIGNNSYTPHAFSAYVSAVAAVTAQRGWLAVHGEVAG